MYNIIDYLAIRYHLVFKNSTAEGGAVLGLEGLVPAEGLAQDPERCRYGNEEQA
jgi:hypothetical protein